VGSKSADRPAAVRRIRVVSIAVEVHELSREQARRIAVRAQKLDADRPNELIELVKWLGLLQIDPTAAIAPNADLVAWSRLGAGYQPEHLTTALEDDRTLFEFNALVRPSDDLPLFMADMAGRPRSREGREWLEANAAFHRDVLDRLAEAGPLLSRDIPDTSAVPWKSTGWTHNRNVTLMLEILQMRGEVAIAGRQGRQRLWDLAERVYPPAVPAPAQEAETIRNRRRLRALGIARESTTKVPLEPNDVGDVGEVATVEGTKGTWRVDPEALAAVDAEFEGRTALLSPFDRLVYDRTRAEELFDFEYVLEMYKPKDKRRWGYFALPILHGDELVGKLDAKANRKAGALEVYDIHEDIEFTPEIRAGVDSEIEDLAAWLGLALDS
jgi:uncharacterized protein